MRINGVGVFLLARACGIVARLRWPDKLMPDQLMTPCSQAQTVAAGICALLCAPACSDLHTRAAAPRLSLSGQAASAVALLVSMQDLRNDA